MAHVITAVSCQSFENLFTIIWIFIYFHSGTNFKASNYRLTVVDLTDAKSREVSKWTDLIKEDPKDVLEGVYASRKNLFVAKYIRDVTSRVQLHRWDGSLIKELNIPMGAITGLNTKREQDEVFYGFTSFLIPGIVYHLKLDQELKNEPTIFKEAKPQNFDHTKFVTEQVFYPSKDGTKVPMFLVHRKVNIESI